MSYYYGFSTDVESAAYDVKTVPMSRPVKPAALPPLEAKKQDPPVVKPDPPVQPKCPCVQRDPPVVKPEVLRLNVKRLTPLAVLPQRSSPGDAGYDLSSIAVTFLEAGARVSVSTGLSIQVPDGYYGRIASRSGLSLKNGIEVGAGVLDSSFRGVVSVLLYNHGSETVTLPAGSRVAQLIIEKIATPVVVEVESLHETARGEGGFGSTGL